MEVEAEGSDVLLCTLVSLDDVFSCARSSSVGGKYLLRDSQQKVLQLPKDRSIDLR